MSSDINPSAFFPSIFALWLGCYSHGMASSLILYSIMVCGVYNHKLLFSYNCVLVDCHLLRLSAAEVSTFSIVAIMDTIQKSSVFCLEKKREHVGQFQGDCGPFYGACMIQLKMQVPVYVENACLSSTIVADRPIICTTHTGCSESGNIL